MKPILDMREVAVDAQPPYDTGLRAVTCSVGAGDLALIRLSGGESITPLADVASGLLVPAAGVALFEGREWTSLTPEEAAAARGRIGRVFERAGWLSNLDVDENITLAQRYHGRRSPEETLKEARVLARELGIGDLPVGRPAFVDRDLLLRCQWIRALMGQPTLLLLERAGRDLPASIIAPLIAAVNRRREQDGLAVLWLTDAHERIADSELRPTRKFAIEGGVFRSLENE